MIPVHDIGGHHIGQLSSGCHQVFKTCPTTGDLGDIFERSAISLGIKAGEKAWQTAIREVREETSTELSEIWSADILEQFYEADKECTTLVPVFVSMVPRDTTVTLNDEHDAYEWVSFEKANTKVCLAADRLGGGWGFPNSLPFNSRSKTGGDLQQMDFDRPAVGDHHTRSVG